MELNEFVEMTLKQIIEGVQNAQQATQLTDEKLTIDRRNLVNPGIRANADGSPKKNYITTDSSLLHFIEFDVAVTSSTSEGGKAGANLSVAGIGFGADVKGSKNDTVVNRIKFQVPVKYPRS